LCCKIVLLFFLGSLFPCTLQGRLFPLLVHVMFCWFLACIASLSCSFLIYTFLTFDQKKERALSLYKGVCSLCLLFSKLVLLLIWSRDFCSLFLVLLVSSFFLIYTILTFYKKKEKKKELSIKREKLSVVGRVTVLLLAFPLSSCATSSSLTFCTILDSSFGLFVSFIHSKI
jgi:L-asparagine transporter-like permease